MDLSILIPARNEMFLKRTVEDILEHKRAHTEIIVVLDGEWADPPLIQSKYVKIIKTPKAIGQRQATNLAARLSDAEFIMKLDAHCGLAKGFDTQLITSARELGPLVTQVPSQWNLHAFDWKCRNCDYLRDQGPTPTACNCSKPDFYRNMVWERRRLTEHWRFDSELKFGYWGELKHRPGYEGDYSETLSCLGACWFLSRERYWQLGGLDEGHGSWGQMGTEIGCKSWLSGGRLVTNRKTWFSHMFRTQGGDFGFPYPLTGAEVDVARRHSQKMWRKNKWPKQVHEFKWLIDKFWPIPGWTEEERNELAK